MLYELVPLFLTNIIAALLIFVILLAHTVGRSVRLTLIFTILSLLLWQNSIYVADEANNALVLWNTAIFIWPTAAVLSCYGFIRQLHKSKTPSYKRSRFTIPIIIVTVIQALLIVSLSIFTDVEKTADGLEIIRGWGYYVYLGALFTALICLIAELVVRRAKSIHHAQERRALNVVLTTVIVATSYGIIANVLIPLFTGGQNFINLGVFIIDIFAIGLWLSITRAGLLDIRFYAIRTVVYIFSLTTLVMVYAILAFVLSQWLLGYNVSSLQSVINIVLALVLAFIFQPVRRFFDRVTSKVFYRDSYDKDVFYADVSHVLSSTSDLRILLGQLSVKIAATLKSEQALFFIRYGEGQHISSGVQGHSKIPVKDIAYISVYPHWQNSSILIASTIPSNDPVKRLLISHQVEVVLALGPADARLGYMFLGDQKGSGYTNRDIKTLESIADELVIGIRNALSIQEVRELNATLQQRVNDATKELRASNAQLQRLDKAKDEFVSMASHQLRTPLTSVKGYISMVLEGDAGKVNDMQAHLLQESFNSSERMVHLINDFLNVSRLQTGKFLIDKHPVDLAKVVGQELDSLANNAAVRGLSFTYKAPKNFPILDIDEGKIRQVIMNFADNALYYSPEKTKVAVKLVESKGQVVFSVKDNGIGVPRGEQSQLFSKFYRASNARKQRPDGTGVGLFLAKKVVDAHGGDVLFESIEGKGSTFGFTLPIEKLRVSDTNDLKDQNNNH
jgi:signal transduction histidine kinase